MFELQAPDYIRIIASHLNLKAGQVRSAIQLLSEGNTVPFIARYRKEMTGELDENQLRDISSRYELETGLQARKTDVVRLLAEQGVFEDEGLAKKLIAAIKASKTITEVDDIYRPYRPKRKTRASIAREKGLMPLANWLIENRHLDDETSVNAYAGRFVSAEKGVLSIAEALSGAQDIFAEEVADDAGTRKWIREETFRLGFIKSIAVDREAESVYTMYYDYQEPVVKVLPHRILALNRGEREGFLKVSVVAPAEQIFLWLERTHVARSASGQKPGPSTSYDSSSGSGSGTVSGTGTDSGTGSGSSVGSGAIVYGILQNGVMDAYKRLIAPAIEREIRAELTLRAEEQAIHIFGENLRNLLMQPPIRGKTVLGVDPAYRTGCKLAVVDDTGKMLDVSVIYPTPPQNKISEAKKKIGDILDRYQIELITIGNGTASRETEAFIAECVQEYRNKTGKSVPFAMVSEAGASVYSASVLAGEEFPDLDVSERSAISIARRIQDPLAELVKIDPKSVGVGQYQHDVSQKRLDEKLASVVESAVNQVGVDINTASPSLLSYVAGLNKTVAKNIVLYREKNGRFSSRKMLAKVPRLGPKTLEQCVGFLRVLDGEEVLDSTPIHPESYGVVVKLLRRTGDKSDTLRDAKSRIAWLSKLQTVSMETLSLETDVGIPTLKDILDALLRPLRDPRDDIPQPVLRTDVLKLEDIEIGMILTGTVRNVVDFGAFVDVGVKHDGLVHISQLSDRFVKNPLDVVSVGDIVRVRVLQIDLQKQRLSLSMKEQGV